jgi:diaminopimelate decarboxylase
MERVAFGPPPMNAAKIAALIDAGIVDPTHVRGARLESDGGRTRLCSDAGAVPVDVVVDAVLAPPGAIGVVDPLVEQLLDAGDVRVLDGRRGIEVDEAAGCVGASGSPTEGLAAAGRMTEDSVIGNDTLSRTLHPQLDAWAARIAARAREPLAMTSS